MERINSISNFFVIGINYRNTHAGIRGDYAISTEQNVRLLQEAAAYGIKELFILSTCNRTEIFAIAPSQEALIQLLCLEAKGSKELFIQQHYCYNAEAAINHLLEVASGLDSQILGDYEIVSQIKIAFNLAKEHHKVGILLDRIFNTALQTARLVRSQTQLSSGSVSVSFAAVQYIKQHFDFSLDTKILLLGTGKIGRNTCKNIVQELGTRNINLYNRTAEKAYQLAEELGLCINPNKTFEQQAQEADIILVATNAPAPTLLVPHVANSGAKLIIDLSIPFNVDKAIADLAQIKLLNVDELSKESDQTLLNRMKEVPKVQAIIAHQLAVFSEWYTMRLHVPFLKIAKDTLQAIQCQDTNPMATNDNEKIQLVLNQMAVQFKQNNKGACNYISAIHDFIRQ